MPWPQDPPLVDTGLTTDGDSPLDARATLKELLDRVNLILDEVANNANIAHSQNLADLSGVGSGPVIARQDAQNTFTKTQTIRGDGNQLAIDHENASTAIDFIRLMRQGATAYKLRQFANFGLGLYRGDSDIILDMAFNCKRLFLGENDITYDGQSLINTINSSATQNGWVEIGPILLQWGYNTSTSNQRTITFPRAFSATAWSIQVTDINAGQTGGIGSAAGVTTRSASNFGVTTNGQQVLWFAVGAA